MRSIHRNFVLWAVFIVNSAFAENLPLETFSKLPPIYDISLSTDGSKAVALKAVGDTYFCRAHGLQHQKNKVVDGSQSR